MTKKLIYVALVILIAVSFLLSACSKTTTTTPAPKSTVSQTSSSVAPSQTTAVPTTTVANANWWDKDGTPQYGGTINLPTFHPGYLEDGWDPYNFMGFSAGWYDDLFCYDWTLDRNTFSFQSGWVPDQYMKGSLVESWEWSDPQTMVLHIQKGVHWQNKPPVNGREFTAHDVVYHFDRLLGTGSGFTKPAPTFAGMSSAFQKFEAMDDYTVVAHFTNPTPVINAWTIFDQSMSHISDAKEWVDQNDLGNWKSVVGTGPFQVTDFVSGSSMTLSRNPNYWGHDQRYPNNQLPYADTVNISNIPDIATELAALKTGKIDSISELSQVQAQSLAKDSPNIIQKPEPAWSDSIAFRIDKGPFSDIRVRKAMDLAINRDDIAKSMFGTSGETCGLIPPIYKGYTIPYSDWPADLKAEYSFNPTEAKELLSEAGYPTGFNTDIIAADSADIQLLQIYKSEFHDIGIEMDINEMDGRAVMPFIAAHKQDAMSVVNGGSGNSPLVALQGASKARNDAVLQNDSNYEDLLNKVMNSKDSNEAMQYSSDAVMYVLEQHWQTGPIPTTLYNVWQPYLKGYNGEAGASFYAIRGWYYAHLWVDQSLKK